MSNVFVAKLSPSTTKEGLREFFAPAGEIKRVNLRKVRNPFAFVEFVDPESVNKAVEMFNNQVLDDATIVVEVAKSPNPQRSRRPRPETPISKNVAHVGNLPYVVDEEGMKDIFEGCKFTEVHVVRYNRSQRSKGYGFVTFANEEDRAEAIKMVDGSVVEGRKITVAPAHERVEVAEAAAEPAAATEETPVENQ